MLFINSRQVKSIDGVFEKTGGWLLNCITTGESHFFVCATKAAAERLAEHLEAKKNSPGIYFIKG